MSSSPIADLLARLHEQWRTFSGRAEARLLVWQAAAEEEALIDAFVARECEAESAATPDLFVQLSAPFGAQPGHGYALATELGALYEEAAQLAVAEQPVRWRVPTSRSSRDDVELTRSDASRSTYIKAAGWSASSTRPAHAPRSATGAQGSSS